MWPTCTNWWVFPGLLHAMQIFLNIQYEILDTNICVIRNVRWHCSLGGTQEAGNDGSRKQREASNPLSLFCICFISFVFVLFLFCISFVFLLSLFCLCFVFVLSLFCICFVFVLYLIYIIFAFCICFVCVFYLFCICSVFEI